MKKFLAVLLVSLFPSMSAALDIPDKVGGWTLRSENIVPLITQPDNINLGRCVYRDYVRDDSLDELQVILTEGKGTGTLYVPENVKISEGVLDSSSGYKVMNISGKAAILETNENLPAALTVRYDENITLTVETSSLSEAEIVMFAENLLEDL